MTDDEFVSAFESCTLPPSAFHHSDHIRLARIYLHQMGLDAATERFIESLKRFAAHLGKSEKYHETMTIAWMRVVAATDHATELDKDHLYRYYSRELLETPEARMGFVEPDLQQLP
jgi:N-formylglutamate deformylase